MNYTIFTREHVAEKYRVVPDTGDKVRTILNIGNPPVYPGGAYVYHSPPTLDIYSPDANIRKVLLADASGVATYAEIKAAFPSLIALRLSEIRKAANVAIEKIWPLWAQLNCANGIYSQAVADLCRSDIAAIIVKSNTAEDAINNAVSMDELMSITLGV